MKLPDNKEELHMTFEIEYLDGSPLANYVRVDASDEETALAYTLLGKLKAGLARQDGKG